LTGPANAPYAASVTTTPPPFQVLFVCAGNTCRSPLAAALLRRALGSGSGVRVESAGVVAVPGSPATRNAQEVARVVGLDLSAYRAHRLDDPLLATSDLILTMDSYELEVVRQRVPGAADRASLVTDFAREKPTGEGIPDPFGGSLEAYEECLRRLEECVSRILPAVLREARARGAAGAGREEGRSS